jgi:phosphoglycerate dehydrogenase-like enzyme
MAPALTRRITTDAFCNRNIVITSAYAANAVPVAEYTLSTIRLSLRHFCSFAARARAGKGCGDHMRPVPGGYQSTVGLISCGMIAGNHVIAVSLKPGESREVAAQRQTI